jgi:nitroreductase
MPAATLTPLFAARRSPRAFREDPLAKDQIAALFEAARRAPSCFNDQPWHFVHASRGPARERLLATLAEPNRVWAQRAPLVGIVFARKTFGHDGQPNRWGEFDAGAASMSLMLQAHLLGLEAHLMGGFDAAAAAAACGMDPAAWTPMAAFVVGQPGDPASLPDKLREREIQRSPRKPLAEVARELADPGARD